ncbi:MULTISPECIES: efflux RND transporter periplasmic adaptor subunit [unclassified Leptolyngbya]|uniref:efflux RND transporter periplasmic adaptor subunit n=1 Tax=unclassified Leptolyngbya TaxID=2650499 RepID=UPI0016839995|nr:MULTISPECIES: efflux RND transporter periplasmic adaptor subunit [unclassified Leptolyngbya]MBD1910358.1 efflux RND transporter periplasmic adaptor subunit [Leptolyngbya sp. FACHB-8]MBD2154839.1 efflux RND transporter periplasmic adaptor subunit [Leptolyngbya sp. FACHB-16]
MAAQFPMIKKGQQPPAWLLALIAAGVVGLGTAGVITVRQKSEPVDISALTVPVEAQALTVQITANGRVQPVQTVNLSPKNAGVLEELLVEQGERIQKGQIIARMESSDLQARLTQAEARVEQARAQLARVQAGDRPQETAQRRAEVSQAEAQVADAQTRLSLAETRLNRNRTLQAEGAISQDDLDAIEQEARSARANLASAQANRQAIEERYALSRSGSRTEDIAEAEAQLKEAIGNLQSAQVQLEDTIIRAPFTGIVTQKYATEGAFVTPTTSASDASSATSTAIVALANGLEVLAEVPEVDIGQITVGQQVEIRADALPNKVFKGRVRLVAPEAVVEQNVTSFQVRVEVLTGEADLLSGMNVDLTFLGDRLDSSIVVPTVAIVTKDGQSGVLVPDERSTPEFRPVTLGSAIGDQTQVLQGLNPGERVFIDLPPEEAKKWMNPNDQ